MTLMTVKLFKALKVRDAFYDFSYRETLETLNLITLDDHRAALTADLFEEIVNDEHHKLHALLPPLNSSAITL